MNDRVTVKPVPKQNRIEVRIMSPLPPGLTDERHRAPRYEYISVSEALELIKSLANSVEYIHSKRNEK